MRKFLYNCLRSLFIRLAVVLLLAAVILNMSTYHLFFNFLNDGETSLNRNLVQYAHFLVSELGTPPDREKAEHLGRHLHMRITLDAPTSWVTGPIDLRFPEKRLKKWYDSESVQAFIFHGYQRIRVRTGADSSITFDIFPTEQERASMRRFGLVFLLITALILFVTYWVIRYLLRPVRWLTDAAANVRDGDLSRRVPEKRGGELRDLSRTFNEMVTRLEGVMQAQQGLLLAVSHELRTPITRLKLQLEMMGENEQTRSMREDLLEMEAMITSLLDAARMRHQAGILHHARTDLNALLHEQAQRHAATPPGVRTELPSAPLLAMVDPERMGMLVSNLLDNALKYSPPDAGAVLLQLLQDREEAVITVRDHGVGITEEHLSRLFEPFFRVDASRTRESGGFGLGLSLCQAIVQAHGGSIRADSVPDRGTTITVRIPLGRERMND